MTSYNLENYTNDTQQPGADHGDQPVSEEIHQLLLASIMIPPIIKSKLKPTIQ